MLQHNFVGVHINDTMTTPSLKLLREFTKDIQEIDSHAHFGPLAEVKAEEN